MNKRKRVADHKHRRKRMKMEERRKAAGGTARPVARVAVAAPEVARSPESGAQAARRAAPRRRTAAPSDDTANSS